MDFTYSIKKRNRYPWVFLFLTVGVGIPLFAWNPVNIKAELIFTIFGSVAAFFHFLYVQHNSDTQRFIELFRNFNERYAKLNDELNRIYEKPDNEVLTAIDKKVLYAYFNLCAEEFLFYQGSYIDKNVWASWQEGMKHFAGNKAILRLWEDEIKQGSYYEFDIAPLKNNSKKIRTPVLGETESS